MDGRFCLTFRAERTILLRSPIYDLARRQRQSSRGLAMRTLCLALLASTCPSIVLAQAAADTPPGSNTSPRVVSVVNATRGAGERTRLRDALVVKVEHLAAWRQAPGNASKPLMLFLAGTPLKNVAAVETARDAGDGDAITALRVVLEIDQKDDVRRAWVQVLQTAVRRADRQLAVSVGPADAAPFAAAADARITLDVFPWWTWIVVLGLALAAGALVLLAQRSNLLRDANGAENPPYSLAKHQMAVWTFVIVGAYLYVWLVTGAYSTISTTALVLIGISGATGLVAVTMDHGKREDAVKTRRTLEAEQGALESTLNIANAGVQAQAMAAPAQAAQLSAALMPKLVRLQEVKDLLSEPAPAPDDSRRWYLDLLSDESGVSFHRFQMALWTLVLVLVFARAVYTDLLMPEFDATLLGLLGISSGTYLGFKFPEKPS